MLTWRSQKLLAKKSVRDEELPVLGCLGLVKILGICSGVSCYLIGIAPGRAPQSLELLLEDTVSLFASCLAPNRALATKSHPL